MGDFDDMNATPLGKLPLPAVQNKGDAPRLDAVSYDEILKTIKTQDIQAPQAPQAPQFAPPPQPPQHAPQHAPQQYEYAAQLPPAPQQYAPQRQYVPRRRLPVRAPPAGKCNGGGLVPTLRRYRTSLLVAVVVFAVLLYVAPRLAAAAPQLLTPNGKFNAAGLAVVAIACGGIHRVVDTYVHF